MKISCNWLNEYLSREVPVDLIAETLTSTGLEVESITPFESVKGGLKGVVVGKVLTCEKHPDADRLQITTVDIGAENPLSIVCGAPNVAGGQKVLVATVGTQLHMTSGESLTIKKGKIRGQESHGMICAEDELGIGQSHDGIMVLKDDAVIGSTAAEYLNLESDHILEIGLTPNRTDAFSHIGVARDLVAALSHNSKQNYADLELRTPALSSTPFADKESIDIELSIEAAIRYSGMMIEDIVVTNSPDWLRKKIESIGLQSINNIVDLTNYILHETGQPLHAFDADKLGTPIHIRWARNGETLQILDGTEIKLTKGDVVICGDSPQCLGGVMGGKRSGVSEKTKRIFLESACFHPSVVRKTSRHHGIFSDSSFRFERGTDASAVFHALHRAFDLLKGMCPSAYVEDSVDLYPVIVQPVEIAYKPSVTRKMAGASISDVRISGILKSLGCDVIAQNGDDWKVRVPLFKADVMRQADLDEEILRIHGYDNIEFESRMRMTPSRELTKPQDIEMSEIAHALTACGFNEMMSMSMMPHSWQEINGKTKNPVELLNPISGDLAVMRTSLLAGALQSTSLNRRHKTMDVRGFEFGKIYHQQNNKIIEEHTIALWISGARFLESWNHKTEEAGISELRVAVDALLTKARVNGGYWKPTEFGGLAQAEGLFAGEMLIGVMGSVDAKPLALADCDTRVWYAEFYWNALKKIAQSKPVKFAQLEKFPSVRRDLSMIFPKSIRYADIESAAMKAEKKLLRSVGLFDVYEGKNLGEGITSYALKFMLQHPERTLTDNEIDQAMQRIQSGIEQIGGKIRN
jgi:phenylalanyl-tRNA synthetase beta chain